MKNQIFFQKKLQHGYIKSFIVISFIFAFFNKAECQESENSGSLFKGGSYEKSFSAARVGLAQSVMTVPKEEFHFVVQHRFYEISGDVNEFFGLDYASTRLGFEYGILGWLSAAIGRSMSVQTYDFALKAAMLKQNESNIPLSLTWYSSFLENTSQSSEWDGHDSFSSRLSFVNQIIIARNQGILSFQLSPIWLHSNYDIRTTGPIDVFAIDMDSRIALNETFGIIAEYIPVLSNESFTETNPFTIGLDIDTGGHQFQLILGNSQGTNEKTILTNTEGSWKNGKIYLGFNLTRVFNRGMD